MQYALFKAKTLAHLVTYKENVLGIKTSGTWKNGKTYPHILPEDAKTRNYLDGVSDSLIQKPHLYSHHLNSSQTMCVNFFAPLLKSESTQRILLCLLKSVLQCDFLTDVSLKTATFEYAPKQEEGTNFDFFVSLSNGVRITFEIKYTESDFGKIHPEKDNPHKYHQKWCSIYQKHLSDSKYLTSMTEQQFYQNYQIWRNVSYIQTDKDFCVFLFPFASDILYQEIADTVGIGSSQPFPQVYVLDWQAIVSTALYLTKHTQLHKHFQQFEEKYL